MRSLAREETSEPGHAQTRVDESHETTQAPPSPRRYAIYEPKIEVDLAVLEPAVLHDAVLPLYKSAPSCSSLTSTESPKRCDPLPEKRYERIARNLRWTVFSVYRRLHALVLVPNVVILALLASRNHLGSLSLQNVATAVAVNVVVAVLIRQELVINLLFALTGRCPRSAPLRLRRVAAKIYHLGGVHSGAGIAATAWQILFTACLAVDSHGTAVGGTQLSVLAIVGILDVLFCCIVILAHPSLRARFHNTFEQVHRFAGWTAVILFWVELMLLCELQRSRATPRPYLSAVVLRSPVFWCLLVTTISLVLPWLRLRKVHVYPEPLSNHAIRLHFTHDNLPLCAAPRFSTIPLKEWHAFAGIPEENGHGFSIIVSNAGDWTAHIIRSPPSFLWTRGIPALGVLHVAPIFNKLVLVATGSGIGPILSLLYARHLNCRIIWSTPDPLTYYSRNIIEHVLQADPRALIINTTVSGRPDLVLEAYRLYKLSEAEAIFIISNPKVTRKVVYALESRGVPIFAPIFDS